MSLNTESVIARLRAKTEFADGCWLWMGDRVKGGYGRLYFGERKILAHRISFEVHRGPIPTGLFVLHSCDTPACWNPDHLRVGSHAENMAERNRKGRQEPTAMKSARVRAQMQRLAVVSASDVEEIRKLSRDGRTQLEIAKIYGIGQMTVSRIVRHIHVSVRAAR